MPVLTGFSNNIPLYTYIPMPTTIRVCDRYGA